MRGDLALFDGDSLLERQEILVTSTPKVERFGFFRASYKLGPDAAEVVLDDFASRVELKRSTLTIPVHESSDWESIELGKYTSTRWRSGAALMPKLSLQRIRRESEILNS